MFNNLRSSGPGLLTRLMLIFIVLSFCLWGIGDIFRQGGMDSTVAKVGPASISMKEYQQALRSQQEELRQRLGEAYSSEFARKIGVEARALDGIVNRLAIEQEAAALGVAVGEDDIINSLARNTDFHDSEGKFSKDTYVSMLRANQLSEQRYLSLMKAQMASELVLGIVGADMPITDDLVEALYRVRTEKRVAGMLTIGHSALKNLPVPSEKDIQDFYDSHGDMFMVPEYRALSYVELKESDVAASVNVSDAEIAKAYEDRAAEFDLPERRAIEQLVFEKKEEADKASEMVAAGKALAEIAGVLPALNKDKLHLGEMTKQSIPVAAEEVFALNEGGTTKPAQSPFGWHILRVTKILPAGKKPLADVKEQLAKDIASRAAGEAIYKLSKQFEDAMAGGATLEDAAARVNQKVQTVMAISREGVTETGSKPSIPAYDNFLQVVFATPEKDHSRMVQADNGAYFAVRVDSIKQQHNRPLAEVKQQVVEAVKKEQTDKALYTLAAQIAKDLKAGKKLEEALAGQNIAPELVSTGALVKGADVIGEGKLAGRVLPTELVNELFALKPNAFTRAHRLPEGGYTIAMLEKVIAAPALSAERSELKPVRAELEQEINREVRYYYLQHLRKKYPVTVNTSAINAVSGAGE